MLRREDKSEQQQQQQHWSTPALNLGIKKVLMHSFCCSMPCLAFVSPTLYSLCSFFVCFYSTLTIHYYSLWFEGKTKTSNHREEDEKKTFSYARSRSRLFRLLLHPSTSIHPNVVIVVLGSCSWGRVRVSFHSISYIIITEAEEKWRETQFTLTERKIVGWKRFSWG
jgi:hypothetical protein